VNEICFGRTAVLHCLRAFRVPGLVAFVTLALVGVAQAAGGPKSDEEVLKETIYQGINLLLLLGVIFYLVRKPTREHFAARRERIQGELDQAADLLTRAEQRNSELQRRLVDLSAEVEEIRENAARRAEGEAERILADARAAADRLASRIVSVWWMSSSLASRLRRRHRPTAPKERIDEGWSGSPALCEGALRSRSGRASPPRGAWRARAAGGTLRIESGAA
jgi:vacuolar-type H+-ATPase subunit H